MRAWLLAVLLLQLSAPVAAQEDPSPPSAPREGATLDLEQEQTRLGERFREFEEVAERMADLLQKTDPERSALMRQVYAKAKKDLLTTQFDTVARRLGIGELAPAAKDQEDLIADLESLLELLLSEDRSQRLREERQRLENAAKEVRRLLREQKTLRDRTEADSPSPSAAEPPASGEPKSDESEKKSADQKSTPQEPADRESGDQSVDRTGALANKQAQLAKEARELADNLDSAAPDRLAKPDSERDSEPSSDRPEESENADDAAPAGGESEAGKSAPGQKSLGKSAKSMRDAARELEALKQRKAAESQSDALAALEQAIAELEDQLRQLREEERLERLASLETRCKKMLEIQETVRDATYRLDQVPAADRTREHRQQSIVLSGREQSLVVEVDQALLILEEDGTAAAFPEAFSQIRADALAVSRMLQDGATGAVTLGLEEDIIATLEEMIAAVKREIRASQKGKPGSSKEGGGPEGNPPLVERIGELKLIRALQFRVNQRTERLRQAPGDSAPDEYQNGLADLANRQRRIQAVTQELARESKP